MTPILLWAAFAALVLLPTYAPFTLLSLVVATLYVVAQGPRLRREVGVLFAASIPLLWVLAFSLLRLQDAQGLVIAVTLMASLTAAIGATLDARSITPETLLWHATAISVTSAALGAAHMLLGGAPGLGGVDSRYGSGFSAIVGSYVLVSHSEWWPRRRVLVGVALATVVALQGARTATAVLALALLYALYRLARTGHAIPAIGVAVGGFAALLAFISTPGFTERYLGGDRAYTIGGLTINTMGRAATWPQILADAREAWLLGHGGGRSAVVVRAVWGLEHPHNEVLRILEDFGAIGLAIVLLTLLWITRVLWRGGSPARASLGPLTASLLLSLTDNTIIYSIWMVPTALFVGFGLGVARRQGHRRRRTPPWAPNTAWRTDSPGPVPAELSSRRSPPWSARSRAGFVEVMPRRMPGMVPRKPWLGSRP